MPLRYFVGCFRKYATFGGRATRAEFWWFLLIWFVLGLIVGNYSRITDNLIPAYVYDLVTVLPVAAVGARRLHDTGSSGHLQWVVFVPIIGLIMLIVWWAGAGEPGPNRYGNPVAVGETVATRAPASDRR